MQYKGKYDFALGLFPDIEDLTRFFVAKGKRMVMNNDQTSWTSITKEGDKWVYYLNYNDGQIEGHIGEHLKYFKPSHANYEKFLQAEQEIAVIFELFLDSGHDFSVFDGKNPFGELKYDE